MLPGGLPAKGRKGQILSSDGRGVGVVLRIEAGKPLDLAKATAEQVAAELVPASLEKEDLARKIDKS
jgi:hypothetical protein